MLLLGSASRAVAPPARRRSQDHATRRALDDIANRLGDPLSPTSVAAAEQRPGAGARRLVGGEHDRLDAAPAGLLDDRRADAARADRRRRDLDARVLLADRFARASAVRAACSCASGIGASSGSDIGTRKIQIASIVA